MLDTLDYENRSVDAEIAKAFRSVERMAHEDCTVDDLRAAADEALLPQFFQ